MTYLLVFILGVLILVGALVLNGIASSLGLMSWYDFLKQPSAAGIGSLIWLFVGYPLGLGVIGYFASKLLNL